MRLAPYIENGNFISINAGIGNYNNNPYIPPQRILEVLDMAKDRPQFRITYTQNANLHNAIFTDFQTTQNGDLNIRGFSSGNPIANGKPGTSTNRGRTGFNLPLNTDPANTVEINSGITDVGGLRLSKLTAASALTAANGKALSVDANGDVVLVSAVSTCSSLSGQQHYISKFTSSTSNELCQTRICEDGINRVGIDVAQPFFLDSKLRVDLSSTFVTQKGITSVTVSGGTAPNTYGMFANCSGTVSNSHYGVRGEASGQKNPTGNNYGVYGKANGILNTQSNPLNFGVYGYATGGGPGQNIGVYGKVDAIGGGAADWAGFFSGDVNTTGAYYMISDSIVKVGIEPLEEALSGIMQLAAKSFSFDTLTFPNVGLPSGKQLGLIAEEVEQLYPELIHKVIIPAEYDSLGNTVSPALDLMCLNYVGFIPILISALQELNIEVEKLQDQLSSCCQAPQLRGMSSEESTYAEAHGIELHDANAIILDQNSPNPFADNTLIRWFLPAEVQQARLIFFDVQGRILKTVDINERGNGELRVYASNLSDGTYSYSLIADNKVIDTKKMVKQN